MTPLSFSAEAGGRPRPRFILNCEVNGPFSYRQIGYATLYLIHPNAKGKDNVTIEFQHFILAPCFYLVGLHKQKNGQTTKNINKKKMKHNTQLK